MAFCGKCGQKVEEGVKFCPACGAPLQVNVARQTSEPVEKATDATDALGDKLGSLNNTTDNTADFDKTDIEQNKVMALLSYLGILVLIPVFAARESKFARFHANQGLVLCIVAILYGIVYSILTSVILTISWRLYSLVSIIGLLSVFLVVLAVIGIINALNGKAKELPVIGKFKILK